MTTNHKTDILQDLDIQKRASVLTGARFCINDIINVPGSPY